MMNNDNYRVSNFIGLQRTLFLLLWPISQGWLSQELCTFSLISFDISMHHQGFCLLPPYSHLFSLITMLLCRVFLHVRLLQLPYRWWFRLFWWLTARPSLSSHFFPATVFSRTRNLFILCVDLLSSMLFVITMSMRFHRSRDDGSLFYLLPCISRQVRVHVVCSWI